MTASKSSIKVLLVGAGGLGGIYAWRLDSSGKAQVTTVCRSNYETVKSDGFRITSKAFGDAVYRPHKVVRTVNEAVADGEVYDFVIVCTKALSHRCDMSAAIAPAVQSPHTIIMIIQNGIGIEDPYAARYPNNPIVSTISYIDASQPTSGTITHGVFTLLEMGLFSSNTANYDLDLAIARVNELCQVWTGSGVETKISENIQVSRWSKLVWNASFNTVSVASGGNDAKQMLASPECAELICKVMAEVFNAGKAVTGSELTLPGNQRTPEDVIKDI
ncbi:hypothetical protein FBU59_004019, partial [Linderina macrospora]